MDKNIIKSCYFPDRVKNPYVENIKNILDNYNIKTISIKKILLSWREFKETQIVNFNWFENIENNGKVKSIIEYYCKILTLYWIILNNKKIIYTLHNRAPHNTSSSEKSKKLMMKLVEYSDKIIIMCEESYDVLKTLGYNRELENKVVKINHPSYIRNYSDMKFYSLRDEFGIDSEDLVFLFIGAIAPYKNIELLIQIFNKVEYKKMKLIIAGRPINKEYELSLLKLIENHKNIITKFEYIPEEEIGNYYKTADIVVLPYNKTNALNSGAIYLSFTFSKTVISSNIGTIKELTDRNFVYNYDYNTVEDHLENLTYTIYKVYDEFVENKNSIKRKGEKAFNYIDRYHSDIDIGEKYNKLYRSLVEVNNRID